MHSGKGLVTESIILRNESLGHISVEDFLWQTDSGVPESLFAFENTLV